MPDAFLSTPAPTTRSGVHRRTSSRATDGPAAAPGPSAGMLRRRVLLPLIFGLALICSTLACRSGMSAPAPAASPDPLTELPAFSFLLPAPFTLTRTDNHFNREQSLRLFTAPVLDPAGIEALAARYERRSREQLTERRQTLIRFVCDLAPDSRTDAVRRLEIRRAQQWNRWLNLQERYEANLRYRLGRDVHADDAIAQARLNSLLSARETVRALQRERQQLISEYYGDLLETLKNRTPGGGDEDTACDAPLQNLSLESNTTRGTGATTTGGQLQAGQPTEYLYLPYYLALYRFLSLLRPEERARLLFALHSGETSDN